jgi:phosphoglycolate phosphatase
MRIPTIVFDLDGTLIDTAPDLIETLNVVLAREGLPQVPYETARKFIGGGAKLMIENGLRAQARRCTPDVINELYSGFVDHYAAHIADRSQPFPGVEQALDRLDGCRLAICTNKLEWLSLRLLNALGLTARFAAICGQDTFGVQKPDPEILRATILRAGGKVDLAVMVGDSATDIDVARALGVPVIGVTFGYTDKPVSELNPDRVIDHFDDLPAAIGDLLPPWGESRKFGQFR